MEVVFITIHDLSEHARIKYASDSVEDILGYKPHEIKDKSCWEYFHPDEIPFARAVHDRGIHMDKAAVLNYCQIKHKDGSWVSCECVFTVVYDVLVASTSVYRGGPRSQRRASDAPAIRRIFSSSPRDPRYHMLSYMSTKFYKEPAPHAHEPRAALFLNRYTRSSTVMFATSGVADILGVRADQLVGKSFYFCIAENCLSDAVRCLESAKANDSIAYLRFWFRHPLQGEHSGSDASIAGAPTNDDDEDDGGVRIAREESSSEVAASVPSTYSENPTAGQLHVENPEDSGSSPKNSSNAGRTDGGAVLDRPATQPSRSSALSIEPESTASLPEDRLEIEALVSCSSDGIVVVLRHAGPIMPQTFGSTEPVHFANGLFAAPWAPTPVMSSSVSSSAHSEMGAAPLTAQENPQIMDAIREVAAFAWGLTGINGGIAEFGCGQASGEALPPGGLPIWDPNATAGSNDQFNGFSGSPSRPINIAQMQAYTGATTEAADKSSSEDEIVYKRSTTMPEWRIPARRAHQDAFGSESDTKEADDEAGPRTRRKLD